MSQMWTLAAGFGVSVALTAGTPARSDKLDCYHRDLPGKPYDLSVADWAAMARTVRAVADEDEADLGVIDLTQPGEPVMGAAGPGTLFRDRMGGWVKASSVRLGAGPGASDALLINLETPATCSNGVAQCEYVILSNETPRRKLLDVWGHCIRFLSGEHHGLHDVTIRAVDWDYVVRDRTYEFDGQAYLLGLTVDVDNLDMKD